MELINFEIRILPKHNWKQDYKAAAAVRRICKVEGEGVVSERVAQRLFLVSTLEKKTLKIYHIVEDLNYRILRISAEFRKRIRRNVLVKYSWKLISY